MIQIDPHLFAEEAIPAETRKFNEDLLEAINKTPIPWTLDHRDIRKARKEGKGVFPFEKPHPDCETIMMDGSGGQIPLRFIPSAKSSRGTFLHIHGGGWMYGDHDMQDQRMKEQADKTGMDVLSIGYRLAPEHPYPAANEDCENAALWLIENAGGRFNTGFLAIGGDSAGGHLSATTLLRVREKTGGMPFHAAVFMAGCFDLRMSPSARHFGTTRLVLNTVDIDNFTERYLGEKASGDRSDPDISPVLADLTDMPPAHFSIGTSDPLLDDSLAMAARWAQVQGDTELDIYPGGCHVFQYFTHAQAMESRAAMNAFLVRQAEKQEK